MCNKERHIQGWIIWPIVLTHVLHSIAKFHVWKHSHIVVFQKYIEMGPSYVLKKMIEPTFTKPIEKSLVIGWSVWCISNFHIHIWTMRKLHCKNSLNKMPMLTSKERRNEEFNVYRIKYMMKILSHCCNPTCFVLANSWIMQVSRPVFSWDVWK